MYKLPQYEDPTMTELVTKQIKMGMEYLGLDKDITDENLSLFFVNSDFLKQYETIQIKDPCTEGVVRFSDYTKMRLERMYQLLCNDQTVYDFDFLETLFLCEMIFELEKYTTKRTGERTGAKWKKFKEEHADVAADMKVAHRFFLDEINQKVKDITEKDGLEGKEKTQLRARLKEFLKLKTQIVTDFPHMHHDLEWDFGLIFWDMNFTLFYTLGLFQGLDFLGLDVFSPLESKKEKEDGPEAI